MLGGSNLTSTVAATDDVTFDVINNPTFSGLVTANAGLTLGAAQTVNIGGDSIDEFVGTGLILSSGDLQTTLGTEIVTGEITDGTITEPDLNASGTLFKRQYSYI